MKIFLYSLICFVLVFSTTPAQASYWLVCDVEAEVIDVSETLVDVKILSGVVTDGHATKGSSCLKGAQTYTIDKDDHELELKDKIVLKYDHYGGRGSEGPVSSTKWEIISKVPSGLFSYFD